MIVVAMAQSLLKSINLPDYLGGQVVRLAWFILNYSSTRSLTRVTPYEVWLARKETKYRATGNIYLYSIYEEIR